MEYKKWCGNIKIFWGSIGYQEFLERIKNYKKNRKEYKGFFFIFFFLPRILFAIPLINMYWRKWTTPISRTDPRLEWPTKAKKGKPWHCTSNAPLLLQWVFECLFPSPCLFLVCYCYKEQWMPVSFFLFAFPFIS